MPSLLVTSTDTEVGKTFTTCVLAAYLQTHFPRRQIGIMKPIQCGGGSLGDKDIYRQLFQLNQSPTELNPLYFDAPLAPPLAAARSGESIDLAKIWQHLQALQQRCDQVLIEGLGGLGTPVTAELTLADLAREWRLPTVLVVPVKLGSIGQAVANVALAAQAKVDLRGIILNCSQPTSAQEIADWAPADLIMNLTHKPVWGYLPYLPAPHNIVDLATAGTNLQWIL
jgi:dethiobiotin synthetase